MKAVGVDVGRDVGVGGLAGALELVDDRPAAARALGDVDLDRQVLGGDDVGLDHVGDGERVVDRRVAVAVDALVELAVEGVQVGDDGAGAAAVAQRLGALGARASRGG